MSKELAKSVEDRAVSEFRMHSVYYATGLGQIDVAVPVGPQHKIISAKKVPDGIYCIGRAPSGKELEILIPNGNLTGIVFAPASKG